MHAHAYIRIRIRICIRTCAALHLTPIIHSCFTKSTFITPTHGILHSPELEPPGTEPGTGTGTGTRPSPLRTSLTSTTSYHHHFHPSPSSTIQRQRCPKLTSRTHLSLCTSSAVQHSRIQYTVHNAPDQLLHTSRMTRPPALACAPTLSTVAHTYTHGGSWHRHRHWVTGDIDKRPRARRQYIATRVGGREGGRGGPQHPTSPRVNPYM
jgi:hypothetical protein